ncbi:MAG: hypothetical protein ACKOCN_07955 [Planctomycetaceae bacterium]
MDRPSASLAWSPLTMPFVVAAVIAAGAGCGGGRVSAPSADSHAAEVLRASLATAGGPSEGGSAAVSTGTGWGSISGRFVFAGVPGDPKQLVVDKDLEVCGKDGLRLFDRSLQVDPSSKSLAGVVVFARKVSRVKDASPPSEPLVFDQKQCEFLMPVFAARVGRPIEVKNSDPIGHNTNISGSAFNQLIPAGASTTYMPSAEMGLPSMVTCNIHPWMKAYVIFRKDGYVAVSGADGSFSIPDLPAGEKIEFQAWHERSVGAGGALGLDVPSLKWTAKGRFQVELQADEQRDLGTLEVSASAIGG